MLHGSHTGSITFLKTSVDPRQYSTPPPNMFNQTTFTKNVSVGGNWVIREPTSIPGPVKDSPGAVVWNVQHGVGDIQRLGFIPSGTTVPLGNGTNSIFYQPGQYVPCHLTFDQEVPCPYSSLLASKYVASISPDLGQDFSVVRCYAGMISLQSDAVPIGNTALTGRFAGGSINDIRDMFQSSTGALTESNLQQQTMTSKDGIKNVGVSDGIVSILGPDLVPTFGPPDVTTVRGNGISDTEVLHVPGGVMTGAYVNGTFGVYARPVFLTPIEGCTCNFEPTPGVITNSVQMSPLPMHQSVRISCEAPSIRMWTGVAGHFLQAYTSYQVMHLYASVRDDGTVNLDNTVDVVDKVSTGGVGVHCWDETVLGPTWSVINTATNYPPVSFSFSTPMPMSRGNMYVGSLIVPILNTQYVGGPDTILNYSIDSRYDIGWKIAVEALDLYNSGTLGPTRVLRWDNVSAGQELKLDGLLLAQCVPEGQIAPFVSPTAQMSDVLLHLNMLPWLNAVYNGKGPVRRIWSGRDYAKFVSMLRDHSIDDIMKLSPIDNTSGEAAGLFGDLGGAIGGLFGKRGREIGSSIGQIGDIGAHLLSGSASGQFGSASGQFGGVSGMGR